MPTTSKLMDYAEQQIELRNLGPDGPLGSEHIVAYGGAEEGSILLSDGRGLSEVCFTSAEIDALIAEMADWVAGEIVAAEERARAAANDDDDDRHA